MYRNERRAQSYSFGRALMMFPAELYKYIKWHWDHATDMQIEWFAALTFGGTMGLAIADWLCHV